MKEKTKDLRKLYQIKRQIRKLSESDADVTALQTSIQQAYELAKKIAGESPNPRDYYTNFLLNQIKHSARIANTYQRATTRQKALAFQRYQRYALADITSFIHNGVIH